VSEAPPQVVPLGDAAWTVVLGESVDLELHRRVTLLAERMRTAAAPGVLEIVPAYATVTVFFDPVAADPDALRERLLELAGDGLLPPSAPPLPSASAVVTIPVRYDGPDLAYVARETGLTEREVIRLHAEPEYRVYLLGFAPGFAYLGDLDPALVLPRRSAPRLRVPAGAVAIGGAQTGVYPLATPGGWHLIGSTPLTMFDPAREPAALLRAGDRVRFQPAE
jgi:inhibitor of KinA